jgi:hypothetical protein
MLLCSFDCCHPLRTIPGVYLDLRLASKHHLVAVNASDHHSGTCVKLAGLSIQRGAAGITEKACHLMARIDVKGKSLQVAFDNSHPFEWRYDIVGVGRSRKFPAIYTPTSHLR